jgi:DNA-binding transcriptional LysR family regulator
MDLRQLRYFVAVAERGGFAAAASTLNVAQSALSRHIKLLEHELGGALLERGARGVAATESGKVLLARGRWLLEALDDIKTEVRTENREPSGTVRLGAPSTLADTFYAPLARLFAGRFPRVRLELSDGLTEEMCDRLLKGELDLAMVTAPQPNDHLAYDCQRHAVGGAGAVAPGRARARAAARPPRQPGHARDGRGAEGDKRHAYCRGQGRAGATEHATGHTTGHATPPLICAQRYGALVPAGLRCPLA